MISLSCERNAVSFCAHGLLRRLSATAGGTTMERLMTTTSKCLPCLAHIHYATSNALWQATAHNCGPRESLCPTTPPWAPGSTEARRHERAPTRIRTRIPLPLPLRRRSQAQAWPGSQHPLEYLQYLLWPLLRTAKPSGALPSSILLAAAAATCDARSVPQRQRAIALALRGARRAFSFSDATGDRAVPFDRRLLGERRAWEQPAERRSAPPLLSQVQRVHACLPKQRNST
jgi:hypothetical protein